MRAHGGKRRQRRRMKELGDAGLAPYFRLKRSDYRRWFLRDWRMAAGCSGMPPEKAYRLMDMAREGRPR
jgi:hypothetical protein